MLLSIVHEPRGHNGRIETKERTVPVSSPASIYAKSEKAGKRKQANETKETKRERNVFLEFIMLERLKVKRLRLKLNLSNKERLEFSVRSLKGGILLATRF
jgi:hypothetical protein